MGFDLMSVREQERHEKPIEQGHGFKVYDVMTKHGEREDIVFNHSVLAQQVHAAEKYELHHNGMLPQNHFWSVVVPIWEQDHSFFSHEHACKELLSVLHHNDTYMLTHPIMPIGGGGTTGLGGGGMMGGGGTTMTGGGGNTGIVSGAVPEPSTFVMMTIGFLVLGVVSILKKRRQPKLVPIPINS